MRFLCILLSVLLLLSGCNTPAAHLSCDQIFTNFTHQLFCQEVASDTISLHYTLKDPSLYGIEDSFVSYGNLSTDAATAQASIENFQTTLRTIPQEKLSKENQITYEILSHYLDIAALGTKYYLYQEPLSPTIGIHSQLPVLLSEFPFYSSNDVDTYLKLLAETDSYFDSIAKFEQAKSEAGLLMPKFQLEEVIRQCQSCLNGKDLDYLYSSFEEKLSSLSDISADEKARYIESNKEILESILFPSYQSLIQSLRSLGNTSINQNGLSHLPDGKEYYEYLVAQSTGITEPVSELQKRTKSQILSDLSAMEELLFPANNSSSHSLLDSAEPSSLLNDLEHKIAKSFPPIAPVETTIKYVPREMEESLSPAFYMIPSIDNFSNNVIYINRGQTLDGIQLYTTLAHEGYPGHLYQTIYFHSKNPDPLRSILDFGGYVEGWATYAEMMSYYLAPISKKEATFLQKNASLLLGLYAYADMGIHYCGWSRQECARFFSTYGISDPRALDSIYELIVGAPANYLKYYLGYLKIYDLKKEMAKEFPEQFTQKKFHQAFLDVGPAPFDIVEKYVREEFEIDKK